MMREIDRILKEFDEFRAQMKAAGIKAPCAACVSEYGQVNLNCEHCGGTGICPSELRVDGGSQEMPAK